MEDDGTRDKVRSPYVRQTKSLGQVARDREAKAAPINALTQTC
jgi:hypothetical protein